MEKFAKRLGIVTAGIAVLVIAYFVWDLVRERSVNERLADIINLEDRRDPVAELKRYLSDPVPEVRSRAALAVGRIGGPGSADLLCGMLSDVSLDVAATAAFAVGLCGDSTDAMFLLDMAVDASTPVCQAAVTAAGRLADSAMVEAAEATASFLEHPSPDVRQAACMALFNAGAKTAAPRLIDVIRKETDELVRQTGLYSLARLRIGEADSLFVENLADPDPFTRVVCVRGIGLSGEPRAIHYLEIALNDADPNVVAEAIAQLAGKPDSSVHARMIRELPHQTDEKLRALVIDALRRQKNVEALDDVIELVASEPPRTILEAAVRYLAAVQGENATGLLDSLSAIGDADLRAVCAEGYGLTGSTIVVSRLGALFSDQSPTVRAAALEAITTLDTASTEFYLRRALADPDRVLTVLAIGLIESGSRREYLPQLVEMMSPEVERDVDVRRSIVSAAGTFLKDTPQDSSALLLLINGIGDPDFVVRREAALVYERVFDDNRMAAIAPAETRISHRRLEGAFEKYARNPFVLVETTQGKFEIELYFDVAPLTVLNFIDLVEDGFYNGLVFHRVIAGFVAQGGDPRGDGWGGPPYAIRCEYSAEPFTRGTVGMATSGKDTGGSQFFICFAPLPHLEGRYTVFGQVTSGMETVDRIVRGDVIQKITLVEE